MTGDVELLRGVMIVGAVLGSYRISSGEGGVSAGVKKIRRASIWVGISTLGLTVFASSAAALAGMLELWGGTAFICLLAVAAGAVLLYRFAGERQKYVNTVCLVSVCLSLMLLFGEEGDVLRYLIRGAVYGGYFISALLLFSRIRYRTDESEACECFRGLPVYLLNGAFLSCALHGILKVWEKLFT